MCRSVLLLILFHVLLLHGAGASAPTREALCAELAASIRKNPANAVMRVEDALVINEAYASEIVLTALAAVDGDARMKQKILDAAVDVVPHRRREISQALELSAVPAAVLVQEPTEVQRVVVPGKPEFEVRRAEAADSGMRMPLMEVRRAVIPKEEVRRAVAVKRKRR